MVLGAPLTSINPSVNSVFITSKLNLKKRALSAQKFNQVFQELACQQVILSLYHCYVVVHHFYNCLFFYLLGMLRCRRSIEAESFGEARSLLRRATIFGQSCCSARF